VAVLFTKTLYLFEDIFENIKIPQYMKACLGGLILGIMGLIFPHILGVGYPAIHLALMNQVAWWLMFILVLFKIGATSLTIGSGGSGGIFAPSLFMGAMAGGFFGTVAHYFFPDVTASSGAYAMVGMGAVVSGTTHAPLTAILILFEMTGDYKIILPLMIACIISSLASRQILEESIYTLKLARRGINIRAGKEINVLKSIFVKDVMNPNVETIFEDLSLGELSQKISRSKYKSFPIVDRKNNLTGILTFLDYHDVAFDEDLKDLVVTKELATAKVVTISADDNLYNALEKITSKDFSILPVVSSDNPSHLVGVLTRSRIMDAYNEAVIKKSLFKSGT
jgi:CIC family chloride channel protein